LVRAFDAAERLFYREARYNVDNNFDSICGRARKEVLISAALLLVTAAAFILFFLQNYLNNRGVLSQFLPQSGVERAIYNAIFVVFMFGSLTYQVSRLAFFWNVRKRTRAAQEQLDNFTKTAEAEAPHIEVLVPSYREESRVVWQTLMSAALLDYPNKGVVLLLDNPPMPANAHDRDLLFSSRAQVDVIAALLGPIAARFASAAERFKSAERRAIDANLAAGEAAALYDEAAEFLEGIAAQVSAGSFGGPQDHTSKFFVERILLEPATLHRNRAAQLREIPQSHEQVEAEFNRLARLFKVRMSLFERKRYINLSHAATKAANLNSYISVMGLKLEAVPTRNGLELVEQTDAAALGGDDQLIQPADAKYITILDADSFLLHDYATRMVSAMESPENRRAAVMQTPYTSIPNTPHMVERSAASTTDIYFYVTEGMSFVNAGFWVGASATIRKEALLDIATTHSERGYEFPVYIQDTTLIEDTGATIDLVRRGWRVENYPARLSYSATPPDFGALVVQRRRWANGGLILLPSLFGYIRAMRLNFRNMLEAALRIHYLIMPACVSISMLAMLLYPFDSKRMSYWIYLTLPPYLYLVCRDLVSAGYKRTDLLRAYSLFLLLLPVVLAGVKNSLRQIVFGTKAQFGRTPKIDQRTAIPLTCIVAIIALFAWSLLISYADFVRGDLTHAIFAVSNAIALGYGVFVLIGVRAMISDIGHSISIATSAVFQTFVHAFRSQKAANSSITFVAVPSEAKANIPARQIGIDFAEPPIARRSIRRLTRGTSVTALSATATPNGGQNPQLDRGGAAKPLSVQSTSIH
jgi:cellulose synthase (UDP-forming)